MFEVIESSLLILRAKGCHNGVTKLEQTPKVVFGRANGSLCDHMKKLRTIQVYNLTTADTLARYTILEAIDEGKFWVLHTDFVRPEQNIDTSKFEKLTIERLFDVDLKEVEWCDSLSLAIEAHDLKFEDWGP